MDEDPGILKFVRGVDLSKYRSDDLIFSRLKRLENLRWIKLNSINLRDIPDISALKHLEYLSLKNNQISSLILKDSLHNVSTLNFSRNSIRIGPESSDKPPYDLDTSTLDLSHNQLEKIPEFIETMVELSMLNLSYNKVKFLDLSAHKSLIYLDVSHNQIDEIILDKCIMLQDLNLSFNNINTKFMNQISLFTKLNTLNLASLNLQAHHLSTISCLTCLTDLNLSYNNLEEIPDQVIALSFLIRLNVSNNKLTQLHPNINQLSNLRLLNVSFNMLSSLPDSIGDLLELRRLFANSNLISSEGIPRSIERLQKLEILMLAFNQLESLSPAVFKISGLKRLILRNNQLITLPESVLDLTKLTLLDTKGNPQFSMPKKSITVEDPYEKMDFSYENVRNMVFTLTKQQLPPSDVVKGDLSKAKMVVHKKTNIEKLEEIKVAEANKFKAKNPPIPDSSEPVVDEAPIIRPKVNPIFRPQMLDCTDIFPEHITTTQGTMVFIIQNFSPVLFEDQSRFYRGDCFIVLNNVLIDGLYKRSIYFWIGSRTAIDKRTCAAMHAVNLKNYLGFEGSTLREEEGSESDEFIKLFPFGIEVLDGEHVPSALCNTSIQAAYIPTMYRVSIPNQSSNVVINKVNLSPSSLDPRFVFILLDQSIIYVYFGNKAKIVLKNKSTYIFSNLLSLFAEKLNQHDRKNRSKIITVSQFPVEESFWKLLGGKSENIVENSSYNQLHLSNPILYQANLGSGYLELPQIQRSQEPNKSDLSSEHVYIVDFWDDIYVWSGKKTDKITREAARRLALQLLKFFVRPNICQIQVVNENQEDFIFLSRFFGWNDSLINSIKASTSEAKPKPSLALKPKPKLLTHADFNLPKLNISNIFMPRPERFSIEKSQMFLDAVDEYLEKLDCFVFDNKNFIKMPETEKGHFYSSECYVFLCKTVVPVITNSAMNDDDDEEAEYRVETKYKVFFWEGVHCPRTGYLTFAFSLQKQFEDLFGDKLSIERIQQQQEPLEFLALFHPTFVIHRGVRPSSANLEIDPTILSHPRLYQIRSTSGILTLRCVEIDLNPALLCSRLHHILTVSDGNQSGNIYLWVGNKVDQTEINPSDIILQSLRLYLSYNVIIIHEGIDESAEFWSILGGKQPYDRQGLFIDHCRLFRCSNESGFYATSEKMLDFCQKDLIDDDVMMLDTGNEVYLWEGTHASDMEKVFTAKLAPIYVKNCILFNAGNKRKIEVVYPGKEPIDFQRVFQGFQAAISIVDDART